MSRKPLFSVVVVSLNAKKLIIGTVNSVLKQTCDDYELIIKDGVSDDGTLDSVPNDAHIKVICQKDTSIYDAMNQAIMHTCGKYIIFMNCGDEFIDDLVLERVKDFVKDRNAGLIYGDYIRDGILHKQPSKISRFYSYRTPLCHQTIFFNGDIIRKEYQYNTEYRLLADYDLELKIMKKSNCIHLDIVVCSYLGGGVSELQKYKTLKLSERKSIIKNNFSHMERLIFFVVWKCTFPSLRAKLIYGNKFQILNRVYQFVVNKVNK